MTVRHSAGVEVDDGLAVLAARRAGVVDDDVDAAELGQRLVGQLLDGVEVGHVGHERDDLPALGPDLVGHRLDVAPARRLLVVGVAVGDRPVPVSTMSQPALASATAIGRPIERIRPAPVTTATLLSNPVSS